MTVAPRRTVPALLQIDAIRRRIAGGLALQEVCRYLRSEFPHYRWVGVYRLEGRTLVLEAWDGPEATAHTRIPIDRGICGRAAREGTTVIVADVRTATEYLACFLETRSEIVVPIHADGTVVGEIDIDGHEVGAYDVSDRTFLESVAARQGQAVTPAASAPPHA